MLLNYYIWSIMLSEFILCVRSEDTTTLFAVAIHDCMHYQVMEGVSIRVSQCDEGRRARQSQIVVLRERGRKCKRQILRCKPNKVESGREHTRKVIPNVSWSSSLRPICQQQATSTESTCNTQSVFLFQFVIPSLLCISAYILIDLFDTIFP